MNGSGIGREHSRDGMGLPDSLVGQETIGGSREWVGKSVEDMVGKRSPERSGT